jgi:hypothetical protein
MEMVRFDCGCLGFDDGTIAQQCNSGALFPIVIRALSSSNRRPATPEEVKTFMEDVRTAWLGYVQLNDIKAALRAVVGPASGAGLAPSSGRLAGPA